MHPSRENNRVYNLGGLFGGGGQTPPPPPPVPTRDNSAGAAAQQQILHADVDGQTYASTLLTGAASPVQQGSVKKSVLLGG